MVSYASTNVMNNVAGALGFDVDVRVCILFFSIVVVVVVVVVLVVGIAGAAGAAAIVCGLEIRFDGIGSD